MNGDIKLQALTLLCVRSNKPILYMVLNSKVNTVSGGALGNLVFLWFHAVGSPGWVSFMARLVDSHFLHLCPQICLVSDELCYFINGQYHINVCMFVTIA